MRWAQVSVVTTHEAADLIANILMELGAAGVEIDDPSLVNEYIDMGLWDYTELPRAENTDTLTIRAYLPEDAQLEGRVLRLSARVEALREGGVCVGAGAISHTFVADEDWAETWKAYVHAEKIGERIVVRPTWEEYTPSANEIVIDMDPGAAFGTGAHATTAMCLRSLEHLVAPGMRVYDVGCGSGILAVAAAKLGAGECRRHSSLRRISLRMSLSACSGISSATSHGAGRSLRPASSTTASKMWSMRPGRTGLPCSICSARKNGRR